MTRNLYLSAAGRCVGQARDQVRRYCGLPWSGGESESWAYEYYDCMPTGPDDEPGPPDMIATAALHPGFSRPEMVFFNEAGYQILEDLLSELPRDVDLADADESCIAHLASLSSQAEGKWLSVLSKVAHRKRPRLIPLFDRVIVDWYRPVTGERGVKAWPTLLRSMQADLAEPSNRALLADLRSELADELTGPVPSDLRLLDVAIWMEGRN